MEIMGDVKNFHVELIKLIFNLKFKVNKKTFMMILLHEDCVNIPSKL
jgi:hypothetical protein